MRIHHPLKTERWRPIRTLPVWLLLTFALVSWPWPVSAKLESVVEVGIVVARTGKARNYGEAAVRGARLAADEVNDRGGVMGRRLELRLFDNRSTPLDSKQAALAAVRRKVIAVVGAVWSTHSLAIGPVLQKNHIPMISPGSTAPEVTRKGRYLFRTCYTDDFQGKIMAEFAFYDCGYRKAAVLTNFSEAYSKILAQYFSANFGHNGGQVVYQEGYNGTAADFRKLLTPLITLKPDVVFVPGYSQDSGLIVRQARKMGIKATFMGGDAWETAIADFAGEALEGCYFSTFWDPRLPNQRNREFLRRYKAKYGEHEISAYSPLAYDAVWLIVDAIDRSQSLNPEKIRDAIADTRNYHGATGQFTFNDYGDPVSKGASILRFTNGEWLFYKAFEPK